MTTASPPSLKSSFARSTLYNMIYGGLFVLAFDLTGKVAIVTGGASGIGVEYCTTLASQGCSVAIFDVSAAAAEERAAQLAAAPSAPTTVMWRMKRMSAPPSPPCSATSDTLIFW